jgi:hypothetical protein
VKSSLISVKLETSGSMSRNNLFSPLCPGTRHIAIGYPNDLLNRTFNRRPEKPDRF